MKKLNLFTAIYSLITSIVLLSAPLITLLFVTSDVIEENGTQSSDNVDMFFRIIAAVMIILGIVLIIKVKQTSVAGKILIIIAGLIVLVFSSFMGVPAGICGIIGASLLLASRKKIT